MAGPPSALPHPPPHTPRSRLAPLAPLRHPPPAPLQINNSSTQTIKEVTVCLVQCVVLTESGLFGGDKHVSAASCG